MNRNRFVWAVLPVVALLTAACSSSDNATTTGSSSTTTGATTPATSSGSTPGTAVKGSDTGELVMGLLVPESGDLSAIVNSLAKPTQLALDQINAAGGVNGKPLKLIQQDDGTDPQIASSSFDKLVNDKVSAIVGPAASGTARGILDKIKSNGVVTCSGSTTAADLTKKDSGGYFFRTAPSDDLQGPALADVITGDKYSKIGILVRNDDYGVGFGKSLEQGLKDAGATVVANVAYNPGGSNFSSDVQQVLDKQPDAVAVIGFNDDGAKVIQAMIAQGKGPDKLPIYTADGMQSSKFAASVDPNDPSKVKGIKGTAPATSPEGVTSPFQDAFKALNVDPIFSSYYWDCTNLLALASQKAKSNDPAKIKDAFAENLKGTTDCNDFKTCKDALDAGKTIHYHGASNNFPKWSGQEPGTGAYEVWAYDEAGKAQTLKVPQIKID